MATFSSKRRNTVSEKDFLKKFILTQFNAQFKNNLKIEDYDIHSITPKENFKLGYELVPHENLERKVKVEAYLNINRRDFLSPFVLKVKRNFLAGNLEDEVFVVNGEIDSAHHLYGGYAFQPLSLDVTYITPILTFDRMPFKLVDGGALLLT